MKNIPPIVKRLVLTGALFAAALTGHHMSEQQQQDPKTPPKIEKSEGLKRWLSLVSFTDKNGDFDREAAKGAFNELNYGEMIPHILNIYEKAQELEAKKASYFISDRLGLYTDKCEIADIRLRRRNNKQIVAQSALAKVVKVLIKTGDGKKIISNQATMGEFVATELNNRHNRIYESDKDTFKDKPFYPPTHAASR